VETDAPIAPPVVAVVVVHRPGPWFEETLGSLVDQDYPNLNTLFLIAGDPVDAEQWIRKAILLQRRDDGSLPATRFGASIKSLQGIAFLQRGLFDDAFRSLSQAQADLSGLLGADDPATHLHSLNVVIALEALGRLTEARTIAERAEPVLRKAFGPDAPTYLRAKALQTRVERESGVDKGRQRSIDFFS